MCWILQGSGWTSEQAVAVDKTLDWRQRPGSMLSAASNTAGYLWAMETSWYFPGPGAWDGTCDPNPLFVWYCRVSYKCGSLHTWSHWTSSARRWREERKTQIVWSHIRRQVLTLAFIGPYVIYSLKKQYVGRYCRTDKKTEIQREWVRAQHPTANAILPIPNLTSSSL